MLEKIIKREIKKSGKITFKKFMELCLYHENLGYYMKKRYVEDFLTPQYITDLYGKLLFNIFRKFLDEINSNTIVEIGAGEGLLAKHILEEARNQNFKLKYIIIEKSKFLIRKAEENLKGFDVSIYENIDDINEICGIIFSNEFFDALPVNIVKNIDGKIKELYLDENLNETYGEISDNNILEYIRFLNIRLPNNHKLEVNLEAIKVLEKISKKLKSGYLITIDYGYELEEFLKEYRKEGTIICHFKGIPHTNPYKNIGNQDITSLVNFTALIKYGEKFGFKFVCLKKLKDIIMENIDEYFMKIHLKTFKKKLEFLYLILNFGEKYKILIQRK